MKAKNAKFSVITVCYNNIDELKRTLKSLEQQTYKNYESIVVDGGSKDGTAEFLKKAKVVSKYVSEPDSGVYNAMNKGIDMASGDYVIFMNSGDTFFAPDVLAEVADATEQYPDSEFVYGDALLILADGKRVLREYDNPMCNGKNICHQSIFYKKSLFEKYGRYDEGYKVVADYDLNLRLLLQYKVIPYHIRLPICVFEYGGLSNSEKYKDIRRADTERLCAEWHYDDVSAGDVEPEIIIRPHSQFDLAEYGRENSGFSKNLVFRLGDSAGLFSEINNMLFAMVYAYDRSIKFCLSSQNSNIGKIGWNEFFEPFTEEINPAGIEQINTRYGKNFKKSNAYKQAHNINFFTQDIFKNVFENNTFMNKAFNFPKLHMFGNSFALASEIASGVYRLNDKTQKEIRQLQKNINLPERYLAIQVRRGDIKLEIKWHKQQLLPVDNYIREITKYDERNLFIFTDDYAVVEEFKQKLPEYKIFSLCEPDESGFVYADFSKVTDAQRHKMIVKILANVEICRQSKQFIGTRVSNPSIFLGLIMPPEKFSLIDAPKLMWQKQIDAQLSKPAKKKEAYKKSFKLFNFLPLCAYNKQNGRQVWRIFGIPVWKIRKMENKITSKYYLFGIPVMKISVRKK